MTMRRRLLLVLGTLVLGATTARGAALTVRDPAFGLPHVFGDTDAEMARENGRQIAKDRLGQLILLARVGRGTLYQAFGLLDPTTLDGDIETRLTGYTSSELNDMWAKMPQRERDTTLEYCKGVNDTIDAIYAGTSPEPLEVNLLRGFLSLPNDLFGNRTNISDQVDPFYLAPGGADPGHPNGGFQFTPELAISIGILEIRNFGFEDFDEPSRLAELQAMIAKFGASTGTEIWDDNRFLNDPLAPVSVPDPTTPGFGGPLASASDREALVRIAQSFPRFDYATAMKRRAEVRAHRAEVAMRLGAWPKLGSYAWFISGAKTATGYPWLGGFPQTGIQTPSIMHFAENRSAEGADHRVQGVGMEFAGAPLILIGHTDTVAYTTTTALLRIIDTFFEKVVNEDGNVLRYSDEGTPAPLDKRVEVFRGIPQATRTMWRSHERGGNKGSRAVIDFRGDAEGVATAAAAATLTLAGAFDASYIGGYVAILDGTGAGQIRQISNADANTLTVGTPWATIPGGRRTFVAVKPGNTIIASALDAPAFREESTAVVGFAGFQRAETIMDVRAATRLIPSTHNFVAADNKPFNGIGTAGGAAGNVGYWSSGFSRIRQGGLDSRLPIDGTMANPLNVASGTVGSASPNTLVASGPDFASLDFTPSPINYRYQNPTQRGREFIVRIIGGAGAVQTRRIASNNTTTLTLDADWGVIPSPGDIYEVSEIVGQPETINPMQGYTANWNNKQATADEGDDFGREWRHSFILERLATENSWDRDKQRQLNKDVAGLDGRGKLGRFLIPRLRQAVNGIGDLGNPAVDTVLAALEAENGSPLFGRYFIDPVTATTNRGEVQFLNNLINRLATDIYGDEYSGTATGVPTGTRALAIVQHAIDSAAADLPGAYAQSYSGDYFNGTDWRNAVVTALSDLATIGIPADALRGQSTYAHPLAPLSPDLVFPPTPFGNRGTYEQIIDVGPVVKGEFIFPLGQSGLITGTSSMPVIDPNFLSLHNIWRDWRFAPMLNVSADLSGGGSGDSDGDGVFDGYERWYFGDLSHGASDDSDHDGATLLQEFQKGTDPTIKDTDGDGDADGNDPFPQDRRQSAFLRIRGRIMFGATAGSDRLRLRTDTGSGGQEVDPRTRACTITLSDDNQIYTVTIPAGAMPPGPGTALFTLRDPSGANNGLVFARFHSGYPRKDRLDIRVASVDLSNADRNNHPISVAVTWGVQAITGTAQMTMRGQVGVLRSSP